MRLLRQGGQTTVSCVSFRPGLPARQVSPDGGYPDPVEKPGTGFSPALLQKKSPVYRRGFERETGFEPATFSLEG